MYEMVTVMRLCVSGGIAAGFFSDLFQAQGLTCSVMFAVAAPLVSYSHWLSAIVYVVCK
jgi:hypothetical protein